MTKSITASFEKQKETKGTVRFAEVPNEGQEPLIGTLYVRKPTGTELGDKIKVTVEGKN